MIKFSINISSAKGNAICIIYPLIVVAEVFSINTWINNKQLSNQRNLNTHVTYANSLLLGKNSTYFSGWTCSVKRFVCFVAYLEFDYPFQVLNRIYSKLIFNKEKIVFFKFVGDKRNYTIDKPDDLVISYRIWEWEKQHIVLYCIPGELIC